MEASLPVIEPDRSFAAIDSGRIVGTSAAITFRMMVPGGARIPTAGVTMVGVHPTHRRRGINTGMMRIVLDQAAERESRSRRSSRPRERSTDVSDTASPGCSANSRQSPLGWPFVRGYEPSGHVELVSKERGVADHRRGLRRRDASRRRRAERGPPRSQRSRRSGRIRTAHGCTRCIVTRAGTGGCLRGLLDEARLAPLGSGRERSPSRSASAPTRPGTRISGASCSTSTLWRPSRHGTGRPTSRCSISSVSPDACGSR